MIRTIEDIQQNEIFNKANTKVTFRTWIGCSDGCKNRLDRYVHIVIFIEY
jgi:hypothetical protein